MAAILRCMACDLTRQIREVIAMDDLFCVGTINDMLDMDTRDLTINGECSQCGACCSAFLPVSDRELRKIRAYIKRYHIEPVHHNSEGVIDGACPFLDTSKEREKCRIYKVRPNICRRFICSEECGHRIGCAERHVVNLWDELY